MKYIVTLKRVQWEMKSVLQTAEYSLKHPVDNRNICKICFKCICNLESKSLVACVTVTFHGEKVWCVI